MSDVTHILEKIESGDPAAAEQLLPLVYDELRKLAAARLAHEKPGQTLQATALVHEAYLRLVGPAGPAGPKSPVDSHGSAGASPASPSPASSPDPPAPAFNSRGHFFGAAAEAMRRILVESARRRGRLKRGGDLRRHDVQNIEPPAETPDDHLLALDEALTELARQHPDKTRLVNLRYFAGLTLAESAAAMGISTATADRHWRFARAWLAQQIREDVAPPRD